MSKHETPVSEAGTASFSLGCVAKAADFPSTKPEATLAARLALAGWALQPNELADGSGSYIATRWGRRTKVMITLDAVAAFAGRIAAAGADE